MEKAIIWGDVATWVTGIATIALFVIGFIQIRNERNTRTKAEENAIIRAKRHQADTISSWIVKEDQEGIWVAVSNNSLQPVYQAIINIIVIGPMGGETVWGGLEGKEFIAVVPPGLGYVLLQAGYHGMHRRAGVEIVFMDSAGVTWMRKAEGKLQELDLSAMEYYKITPPISWSNLVQEIPDHLIPDEDIV